MYLSFYGLKQRPFTTTPDPAFLHLTPGHQEALAQLVYSVTENKGFLVLTGEIGTGKTTLIRTLLQRLDGTTDAAFVSNSALSFDGILEYALEDFGIVTPGQSRAQQLLALNRFLITQRRDGRNAVLILDEAQNLDAPTLEHIRLLSNFETSTDKLLQILLVGQPELRTKLEQPELRQLRQRIALRCAISPLTPEETRGYIRTRLRTAGAPDLGLFTERAVTRIAKYARGIPRVVNIVCDHCLLIGYADQSRRIDADVVAQAIRYLENGERSGRRVFRWPGKTGLRWALAAVAMLLSAATAIFARHAQELFHK